VDPRSDIFSFGVVLYELLTGRRPFEGDTVTAVMLAVCRADPPPLDATAYVSRLVARCLRKNPDERFQNVAALRAAIEKAITSVTREEPSIAVLPFVMTEAGPESDYFGEGLTDDIINALCGISGLRVIARTSTFAFKNKVQDVRSIAESLNVDHVLEGSVRKAGNRIRVNTRLIAAHDGAQLWSKRFDRDLIDVFAIQDEISNAIANELQVSLAPRRVVTAPTAHFAAYESVLQGRYHFSRFEPAAQAMAQTCFERAVAIDPSYAAAHIGVALIHWGQMVVGMGDPRESMRKAVGAAREALRLDPGESEGHHILGSYYALNDFDWGKAEHHFDRALELNPRSSSAYHCKAIYLLNPLGRLEEALECYDQALDIDPLSLTHLVNRGLVLESLHMEKEETEVLERLNEVDPTFVGGQWSLVRLRVRQGRISEALALAERLVRTAGRWGMTLAALGAAYAGAGMVDEAQAVIDEFGLEHNRQSRAFYSLLIAAALDDRDQAFRWFEESLEHRDPILLSFFWTTVFDKMRGDPRFTALLRRLKIPDRKLVSAI